MLIQGLCDYYDVLANNNEVVPNGYSSVSIHYLVSLTPEGDIDDIIKRKTDETIKGKNGKTKIVSQPETVFMPRRTEKTCIDSNIIEHRPLYLFGLNYVDDTFSSKDSTNRAVKSHQAFVEKNLDFLDGLHSPVIDAYRNFIKKWTPELETENKFLCSLKNNYPKSSYIFCLSGSPEQLLHDDPAIKDKWEKEILKKQTGNTDRLIAQCCISGNLEPIARIHNKIKGIYGGNPTGTVLVGFNNPSENSYGNDQSFNSNISETAMQKYTQALNYLLKSDNHKILMGETTIICWAMDSNETYEELFMHLLNGNRATDTSKKVEKEIHNILQDAKAGMISKDRLLNAANLDGNIDYYIVGIKPNASRLSVKFIYRKRYGDILNNIANFQNDLQTKDKFKLFSIYDLYKELISPRSKNDKGNPSLNAKLMESIVKGTKFPIQLLETIVRRIKIDCTIDKSNEDKPNEDKPNLLDAGILRAYYKRNYKEDFGMALNIENTNQAYLCGRLFAVMEKVQKEAANKTKLNRTIKDSYFSSAASRPVLVFTKLLPLTQHHLAKLAKENKANFYNMLIGEIVDKINDEFPENLSLKEQGKFLIGYIQQSQRFYVKNTD